MVATRQREPHRYSMCCLRIFCVFLRVILILNPCASYTILLALCQVKYYHTIFLLIYLYYLNHVEWYTGSKYT